MQRRRSGALMLSLALVVGEGGATNAVSGQDGKIEALVTGVCAGCHGQDGNSTIPNIPKIAGQHKTYLMSEMKNYKEEKRHSDVMGAILSSLSAEEMAAVAEYYAAQKPAPGVVTKPELLPLGKRIYLEGNTTSGVPSCDGCHEENGEGSKKFPRVAGQHVPYVLEEIERYATDKRKSGAKVMRTVAERLTKAEAEAVAEYMASLK